MRKWLLALVGLVALTALAQTRVTKSGAFVGASRTVPAGAAGDACGTGNLVFSWHCEDTNVTVGTPTGCSSGDTIGTVASLAAITNNIFQDGTHSLYVPTSGDTVSFDITARDIFDSRVGTLDFYFRYTGSFVASVGVFGAIVDASHRLRVYTLAGQFLRFTYNCTGCTPGSAADLTSTNAMSADTWYHFKYTWTTNNVNPNVSLTVDGTLQVSDNFNPGDFGNPTPPTTIQFGEVLGTGMTYFLDDIKIYNAVQ